MNSKDLINNFFHTFGLELRKYPPVKKLDKREGHIAKLWETFVIDLVMDIGAATGEYVVWIRSLGYQGKVISFEPFMAAILLFSPSCLCLTIFSSIIISPFFIVCNACSVSSEKIEVLQN